MIRRKWRPGADTVLASLISSDPSAIEDMELYEHMFREDVSSGVAPYFMFRNRDGVTAEVDGDGEAVSPILQELGHRDTTGLREQLADAVEQISEVLSWRGRAVFEICRDTDGAVRLVLIPDRGLWVFPGFCVQVFNKRDREQFMQWFRVARSSRVWIVRMPRELGGHWGYTRILRRLRSASSIGPVFFKKNIDQELQGRTYNFRTYLQALSIFQESVTRRWHWNRRDTSGEYATDMYFLYKRLGFRAAQCTLRDLVLAEINKLFVRLGVQASVRLVGLPTNADFISTREKFMKGEMTFKDAAALIRR